MIIGAIIQARMGSTRLPGKIFKLLAGKPALQHVIERVQACRLLNPVVVATTQKPEDDTVVDFAKELSCRIFRGDEEDVLARYFGAASEYKLDVIVRITSD